ncbi:hypothetical protein DL771_003289 [Monosporascus sp. 5C6A]|nr:hypothetical protein DL771_003289 [Monosporascus sp. 5C6A]
MDGRGNNDHYGAPNSDVDHHGTTSWYNVRDCHYIYTSWLRYNYYDVAEQHHIHHDCATKWRAECGDLTLIRDVVGDGRVLQAIGYNLADNYLYGTIGGRSNTPVFLIRIAANGDSTILNQLTLPYRVNTGDVDEQSRYWITYNGTNITQVDVRPSSPTFGELIGTTRRATTLPANNATIYDWAYVPGRGNFLWSLGQSPALTSTTLQRFNRGTYNWELVREFGNIAGDNWWGAIYASGDGFLYATENRSGQIWRFPLSDIDGPPTRFSIANPTRENDGARCIRAQDLPEQPFSTAP